MPVAAQSFESCEGLRAEPIVAKLEHRERLVGRQATRELSATPGTDAVSRQVKASHHMIGGQCESERSGALAEDLRGGQVGVRNAGCMRPGHPLR